MKEVDMKTKCPHCDAELKAPDEYEGKKIKCPKCKQAFVIAEFVDKSARTKEAETHRNVIETCANCNRSIGKLETAYVFKGNVVCEQCNELLGQADKKSRKSQSTVFDLTMDKKKLLGLAGAIILFVGVFTPIVSIPIMGNMNYFQNGKGDGTIIIVLAVISLVLTLRNKYKGLWFTGLGSLGIMAFTFINFQVRMSQAASGLQEELGDNPFSGLGELMLQSIQLQWGWAILILGAGLIVAAAALPGLKRSGGAPGSKGMNRFLVITIASVGLVAVIWFAISALSTRHDRAEIQTTVGPPEAELFPEAAQKIEAEIVRPNELRPTSRNVPLKPADEIIVLKKPMFGIYLGEKLSDLRKRFRITKLDSAKKDLDDPSESWFVIHRSDTIKACSISTFEGRVWSIFVLFKDSSKENFDAIENQLRNKYEIEDESEDFTIDPERTFEVRVDGVPVGIHLKLESAFMEENKLGVIYVHGLLMLKRTEEIERRKAAKVKVDL